MVDFSLSIFIIIGLFVILQLVKFFLAVRDIGAIRLKHADYELQEISHLPAYLKDLFGNLEPELLELGFKFSHCQTVDGPFISDQSKKWELVYLHEARKSRAIVSAALLPSQAAPCQVEFLNLFSDQHRLSTLNGLAANIIGQLPATTIVDPYAVSLKDQWEAHLKALDQLETGRTSVVLSPAESIVSSKLYIDDYLAKLQHEGYIKKLDDHYALRFIPAVRFVYGLMRADPKKKKLHQQRNRLGEVNQVNVPIEVEVETFQRLSSQVVRPKKTEWLSKTIFLLVTLILFALSFGFSMSFTSLLILIVAVFIHELGHVLGMYWFNYKDLQILFLPFLGAVALGASKKAKPYQKAIVLFLGPVPGLILGFIGLILSLVIQSDVVRDAAIMFLALNYFNLLPIMPLDGGQILNLIFFSRYPLIQTFFQVISAIFLAIVAIFLQVYILLVVSFLLLFSIAGQFRREKLLRKLQQKFQQTEAGRDLAEKEILFESFRLMKEQPFARWPFAEKYQMAHYLLNNVSAGLVSLKTTVGALLLYIFSLASPIIVAVFVVMGMMLIGKQWPELLLNLYYHPAGGFFGQAEPDLKILQPLGQGETLAFSYVNLSPFSPANIYTLNDTHGLRPLVEDKMYKFGPVWSPDGTQIIYTGQDGQGEQYYLVGADGTNPHLIVGGEHYKDKLRWSPDGSHVAYVGYVYSNNSTSTAIYVVHMATGETIEFPLPGVDDFVWNSNSQSLLVLTRTDALIAAEIYEVNDRHKQQVAKANYLREAINVTLSPDAAKIAYAIPSDPETSEVGPDTVYVSSLDGSATQLIGQFWVDALVWSPDSTQLAFVGMGSDFTNALYAVKADGTNLRHLMLINPADESGEMIPTPPAWSPDGTRMAVSSFFTGEGSAIFVINAAGTEQRQLTNPVNGIIDGLTWRSNLK